MHSKSTTIGIAALFAFAALTPIGTSKLEEPLPVQSDPCLQDLQVHQINDYFEITIYKHYVETLGGNTSRFVEQTAVPTRLPMTWGPLRGGNRIGFIGGTSVFGYSTNQGSGPGPIQTMGAWMVRWVVTGEVVFLKPGCQIKLQIWEYDIPGLEVACGPIVGCVAGPTDQSGRVGPWNIEFPPNSGYGWEEIKGPVVVPGTNSKIEVFLTMHREPTVKPKNYPMPNDPSIILYTPACTLLNPFEPPPEIYPEDFLK